MAPPQVLPWKAAANQPWLTSVTGLGAKGGAQIVPITNNGFGTINVFVGQGASSSGSIVLTFPNTPPDLVAYGEEALGNFNYSLSGRTLTLTWDSATYIARSQPYLIEYEWKVSQ